MTTPQFGAPDPALDYRDRPAAFGVLAREDGRIALVTVVKPGKAGWHDLPGGAVDAGEDDAAALVREFGEETGLVVAPRALLGRADQYFFTNDGAPHNNRQALFEARLVREAPELKVEDDHTLVWFEPLQAIARLRHDSHAWAVALYVRRLATHT